MTRQDLRFQGSFTSANHSIRLIPVRNPLQLELYAIRIAAVVAVAVFVHSLHII
jgi:hypothetical protein